MTISKERFSTCGFIECEACRSKPGSPVPCDECLRRRMILKTMNDPKDYWFLILTLMLCVALWFLIIVGAITVVGWLS